MVAASEFSDPPGERISATELKSPKAREILDLLDRKVYDYADLVSTFRSSDGRDGLLIDLSVEVGQEPVNDIRDIERLAILFPQPDTFYPEVLALRADFPRISHLNLRDSEFPRSLCIYEEPYPVVKLSWTPTTFLERIRAWLRDSALGTLHREDQILEPILMPEPRHLVIPTDLFSSNGTGDPEKLLIIPRYTAPNGETLIAKRPGSATPFELQLACPYLAATFQCPPQTHGVIRSLPRTLLDVHDLVGRTGVDLLSHLCNQMRMWDRETAPLNAKLILIVFFPKTRSADNPPEVSDVWAFVTGYSVRDLGAQLGFWERLPNGGVAALIGTEINRQNAAAVPVLVFNPSFVLNRLNAALLSSYLPFTSKVTAVGVGALGSQIIANLIRGGFGSWTVIDDDFLLPHNVARHALPASAVGTPKALSIQVLGNDILEEPAISDAIVADVLNPGDKLNQIETSFGSCDLILDFSASVPVARHLAEMSSQPRRISAFLNPDASDLVLLVENADRSIRLDDLEMQYYRLLITESKLSNHFKRRSINRIRYAQTCRDLSSTIPQDLTALHSAIAAKAIRAAVEDPAASIRVWCAKSDSSVEALAIAPAVVQEFVRGGWRIRIDEALLKRLADFRLERLPNETGGVFIGSFDLERRIVYVVDSILSPLDSQEWPTLYIRGWQGLQERLGSIDDSTAGM